MNDIMNELEAVVPTKTPAENLKEYLDNRGIAYSWVTDQLDLTPAWLTMIFSGKRNLTAARQAQIEEILTIKL